MLSDGAMPLPRTTLCDLSVFRQSRLEARSVSGELASFLASSLGGRAFTAEAFLRDAERQVNGAKWWAGERRLRRERLPDGGRQRPF